MPGYYFNLPPITRLTRAQQAALNEPRQIALSGGPGTGKSVVSMWRHISNHQNGYRSLLLTYTTTLKRYLEACCSGINTYAAHNVGTSLKNKYLTRTRHYYEVIIDEAQDLEPDYFSNIISQVSYGADDSQVLYPEHSSSQDDLENLFPGNVQCLLDKNFRCTQEIMLFVRQAFPEAAISLDMINNIDKHGPKPSLIVGDWDSFDNTPGEEINAILEIVSELRKDTENIAILLPWKNSVKSYALALQDDLDDFSFYYESQADFPEGCPPLKNVHITTFKSAKGLEFDTVIIPDFGRKNSIVGNYNIDWNDYYVGCTRAKSNLYLFSNRHLPSINSVVNVTTI